MREFFKKTGKRGLATLIILALFLLSVAVAVREWTRPVAEPVRMTRETPAGTHVYLDARLLTEWVYQVTGDSSYTYYESMDENGDWYVVSLDDAAYAELQPLVDAYYAADENTTFEDLPEAVRLIGMARDISDDDLKSMAASYRVSAEEYTDFYGPNYFDEGARPTSTLGVVSAVVGLILGFMLIVLITEWLVARVHLRKSDNRLYALGLAGDAEAEFASPNNQRYFKGKLVLSDCFLYAGMCGVVAPYTDVLWLYQREQRAYGILVATYLVAGLADGRTVTLAAQSRKEPFIEDVVRTVAAGNPDLLVGYTHDNVQEFRRRVKELKHSAFFS